jgi:Uma2 family endonuclease
MQTMIATSPISEPTIARIDLSTYHGMLNAGLLGDRNIELLNGQLFEMPPEGPLHADINRQVAQILRRLLPDCLISENHPITLPSDGEPSPDIAIVSNRRYGSGHPGPSDIYLIIEFSNSTLQYDLGDKRRAYAMDGIAEYWVVDINNQTVTVHRNPKGELYQNVSEHGIGKVLTAIAFPDIPIAVADLLACSEPF